MAGASQAQSSQVSKASSPFDGADIDDEFALAMASEASKLTPQLRKHVTFTSDKRASSEEDMDGHESAGLGPDPLKDGTYDGDLDQQESQQHKEKQEYMASEAYKANSFGDFRSYMKNKRLKLKVQELSIAEDEGFARFNAAGEGSEGSSSANVKTYPTLFAGSNIYINGHTNPPYGELRRLIHLHGGELMPYLDTKSPVTHIVASNLTAKKRIEFKEYRVVRPEWITESIARGRRLDWRDFRCNEDASGAMTSGSLAGRSMVGQRDAELEAQRARREIEEARATAARGDWRSMAKDSNDDSGVQHLRAYAQSGMGAGVENGVGPWGRASRQRTLGGWARRDGSRARDLDEMESKLGQDSSLQPVPEEQVHQELSETKASLPPSIQLTAEDERWDEAHIPSDAMNIERGSRQGDDEWREVTNSENIGSPRTPSKSDHRASPPHTPTHVVTRVEDDSKTFSNLGTDPRTEAAAIAAGLRRATHPYAARPSNSKAAQLMASPSWRERNTATSEGFLQGYFTKSRLHHLSTWKSEMREMVGQALREAKREEGSIDLPAGLRRVIFHIDFDAFFVSVGLRNRLGLHDKAVVVCHADADTPGNTSTSEIASCNYVARSHGIRNGMSLGQARRFCSSVVTIPYDFVAYNDIAIRFYTLLLSHADAIEAVSIDEALIDVSFLLDEMRQGVETDQPARQALMTAYRGHMSSQGRQWTEEKQLAEALRDEIRAISGCEASIGIGSNILLARLATRKAKPGGSFHLQDANIASFVDHLDIDDLHGVGWSIRNRCRDVFGTCNVGELKIKASRSKFVAQFGEKHGVTIWDKLHGKERDKLESVKPRQSCGASVNYAIRFQTESEVKDFIYKLSQEVSSRLKAINMEGRVCCISIMVRSKDAPVEAPKFLGHGICDTFNRSTALARLTDDGDAIFATAWKLVAALKVQPDQMRGVGVSLQKLEYKEGPGPSVRRESGQSMLSFAKKQQPATTIGDQADVAQSLKFHDAKDDAGPAKKGGPLKLSEADAMNMDKPWERPPKSTIGPPATQFAIPPASQLDESVLSALPDSIRNQILKSRADAAHAALRSESITSTAALAEDNQSRASSPVTSTTTTPEKARKRKLIDPFERMRAASTTPTKKRMVKDRTTSAATTSSAPSTPSGSQKNRTAREGWEPTWSQIDRSVLAELPDDVREEILRQMHAASGHGSQRFGDAPTTALDGSMADSIARRSHSESPRKKQAYLDVLGLRSKHDMDNKAILESNTSLPPVLPRRGFGLAARSPAPQPKVDPSKVTREELIALEIDPDVFLALPASVQHETLDQQSITMANRKARFKTGRHTEDMTRAQQRVMQRKQAFPDEDISHVNALQAGGSSKPAEMPSIKGMSSLDDVCSLLTVWVKQFAHSGPRERDVQRFARFLVECLEGLGTPQSATRRSNSLNEGNQMTPSLPPDGLEKVHGVLQWWTRLLRQTEWDGEQQYVRQAWWDALNGVRAQIDTIVKNRFGGRLSINI